MIMNPKLQKEADPINLKVVCLSRKANPLLDEVES
jgi:hypothetical protein